MGFLLSSLASELKAADKLQEEGRECLSQEQGASVLGRPNARANRCRCAEARVPEDGDLPVVVTRSQELPAG